MGYPNPEMYMTAEQREEESREQMEQFRKMLPMPALAIPDKQNTGVQLLFPGRKTRIAFPARNGVQPQPGEVYEVVGVSDNAKHTVWFCALGRKIETTKTRIQLRFQGYIGEWFEDLHPLSPRPFRENPVKVLYPVGLQHQHEVGAEFDAVRLPEAFGNAVYVL